MPPRRADGLPTTGSACATARSSRDGLSVSGHGIAPAPGGLSQYVQNLNLAAGISNSLDAKLRSVLEALDEAKAGHTPSVCNRMQAFLNEVAAQHDARPEADNGP